MYYVKVCDCKDVYSCNENLLLMGVYVERVFGVRWWNGEVVSFVICWVELNFGLIYFDVFDFEDSGIGWYIGFVWFGWYGVWGF